MSGSLTPDQIARYRRDGVLFPLGAFAERAAGALADRVAEVERRFGDRYPVKPLPKTYPMDLLPFVAEQPGNRQA